MKTKILPIVVFLLIQSFNYGYSQDHHVRIGFFGNSITIGTGLPNPSEDCYPSQIGKLLEEKYGDTCIIGNFAVSGTTMLKNGDFPLWETDFFQKGWNYAPDICFICLGTNDSKPQNWDFFGDEFLGDYLSMIDTLKLRNPNTKFIVCYPAPAFDVVWDIRNPIIENGVMPNIDSVLSKREAILVDFHHPLVDSVYLFPDKIHPNAAGAKVMAKIAYDKIIESNIIHSVVKGRTFVTSIETKKAEIRKGDTAIISWTSINATEVFLNGEAIPNTGTIKLTPSETTKYTLVAVGQMNKDSLSIEQKVYTPELTLISIKPYKATITQNQSIELKLYFYDQKGTLINDANFEIDWSIIEGDGTLTNKTDSSATYNAGSVGKSKIQAAHGEINYAATITINPATGVASEKDNKFSIYPNPCGNILNLPIKNTGATVVTVKIYNVLGSLQIQQQINLDGGDNQILSLNIEDLNSGLYIYNIEFLGNCFVGKLNKK